MRHTFCNDSTYADSNLSFPVFNHKSSELARIRAVPLHVANAFVTFIFICNIANTFKTLLLPEKKTKIYTLPCARPNVWPKVIGIGQNLTHAFAMLQVHLTSHMRLQNHKCI